MRYIKESELNKLIELIKAQGLDLTWLNYGDNDSFTRKLLPFSYHPEHREKRKDFIGVSKVSVGSLIYQVTPKEFNIYLKPAQAKKFSKCIEEYKQSDRYKKDLKDNFNSYTYEITTYSPVFLKFMGQKWYSTVKMDDLLPLDATKERDEELKQRAIERAEKIKKNLESKGHLVEGYTVEKVYKDTHYIGEEFQEIRNICTGFKGINPSHHPTHQSERRLKENLTGDLLKEYKPVKLKCTGRKMLMRVHTYGFSFVELDRIVK